jgi:hypothetical protein
MTVKSHSQGRIAKTDNIFNKEKVMATLNGRKVVDIEVDGVDSRDYPDFADAYFSYACYEDGTPLTEQELDKLADQNGDILHEKAFDSLH